MLPLTMLLTKQFTVILALLSSSFGCSVTNNLEITRESETRQATLIKFGFSGLFWNYLNSSKLVKSDISSNCHQSLIHLDQLTYPSNELKFKLIDSSGRLPEKFLTTGYADFGDYDGCLEISWNTQETMETGQYCLVSLLPKKLNIDVKSTVKLSEPYNHLIQIEQNFIFKIGFCIPSACSVQDLSNLVSKALEPVSWDVVHVDSCEVKKNWIDKCFQAHIVQQLSLAFLSLMIFLVIISSHLQYYGLLNRTSWLHDFTIQKSFKTLAQISPSPRCAILDQLRTFANCAVILFHISFVHMTFRTAFLVNSANEIISKADTFYYQLFVNDWFTEGFLFLGGIARSLELWRKTSVNSNARIYLNQIIRKFFTIQYSLCVIIMLEIVTPLLVSGPLTESIGQERSHLCINYFWYNLLHIQTNLSVPYYCAMYTWSIATEFHLYLVVCFLIYLYRRSEKFGLLFNIVSIIIGYGLIFRTFYIHKLRPFAIILPINIQAIIDFFNYNYYKSSNHLWSYSISVLLSYLIMTKYHKRIHKNNMVKMWKISLALLIVNCFASSIWNTFRLETGYLFMAFYSVVSRLISGTFFSLLFYSNGEALYEHFSSVKNEKLESSEVKRLKPFENVIKSTYNNNKDDEKKRNYKNSEKNCEKILQDAIIPDQSTANTSDSSNYIIQIAQRITTLALFSHIPMLIWYVTSFKKPVNSLVQLVVGCTLFTVSTLFTGLALHFLFLGPYSSIMQRIRFLKSNQF